MEMLEQAPELEVLIVPVGGGGLIAGVASAAKALKPGIEVIGVQAERFPGAYAAFHGREVPVGTRMSTVAEGIAVKGPGALTGEISQQIDDMVLMGR
jgi:threonine dehydratase